jgi:hypothetical protein
MPSPEELRRMAAALLDIAEEIVSTFPFEANSLRNISRALTASDQEPNEQGG